jgi:hypothetical protein
MGPAVYARVGAVALWQVGLERLHHGAVAAACGGGGAAGAAAGCDGRPCGAVTPTTSTEKKQSIRGAAGLKAATLILASNPSPGARDAITTSRFTSWP